MFLIQDELLKLKGKSVKLVLEEGERISVYNGQILDVTENFVIMHDKFDNRVHLAIVRITRIEEIK